MVKTLPVFEKPLPQKADIVLGVFLVKILAIPEKERDLIAARVAFLRAWRKLLKEQSRFYLSPKMSEVFLQ